MKLSVRFRSFRELLVENGLVSEGHWQEASGIADKNHQRVLDVLVESGHLTQAVSQKALKAGLLIAEGQSLLQLGLSSSEAIEELLAQPSTSLSNGSLVSSMVELGLLPPDITAQVIRRLENGGSQETRLQASQFLLELVPNWILEAKTVLPMYRLDRHLLLAMTDPNDLPLLDDLRHVTHHVVRGFLTTPERISNELTSIDQHTEKDIETRIANAIADSVDGTGAIIAEPDDDLDAKLDEDEAPVIRIVDSILVQAVKQKASDIHFEPKEDQVIVRLRVDGMLSDYMQLPVYLKAMITSRLKIMSKLDISQKRIPQDGRARLRIEGRVIDFRVSTLPCTQGEKVVLRLLDKSASVRKLSRLGFDPVSLRTFEGLIKHSHGIIFVSGPTGSGKTTTLYAALNSVRDRARNFITVEDPVEYELDWATQVSINQAQGLTFPRVLRAILRQDPDVILVGEIRDQETARIAIEAALTGHLVMTTLHANSAPQTVTRLIEMGIEPFLVSAAVMGVAAQRLVRINCPICKEAYTPSQETLGFLGLEREQTLQFFRGTGCDMCQGTGYLGRRAFYEIMAINDPIREAIVRNASANEIRQIAIANNMVTLTQTATQLLREELTTVEEVLRAVFIKEEKEKRCPHCQNVVDDTYVRCPTCHTTLKHVCVSCHRDLDPNWTLCPGCGTPVIGQANLCSSCLSVMKPDWTVCLNCGAPRQSWSAELVS